MREFIEQLKVQIATIPSNYGDYDAQSMVEMLCQNSHMV